METYKIFIAQEEFTRVAENPLAAVLIVCRNGGPKFRYWLCGLEPCAVYKYWPHNTRYKHQYLFGGTAKQVIDAFSASHGLTYASELAELEKLRLAVRKDLVFWAKHRREQCLK